MRRRSQNTSLKAYTNATLNAAYKLVALWKPFFVLVNECSGISRGFYKSVQCYNSLDTKKARREVQGGRPEVNDFLEDYHGFLVDYVVCGNSHRFSLRFPSSALKNIDFCACPKQRNGIDCHLFAIAAMLRIIDGIPVTVLDPFSQEIITALRNNLTSHLANVKSFRKYTLPSGIVWGVFDALPAINDMDPHSSDPDIQGSDPDDDDRALQNLLQITFSNFSKFLQSSTICFLLFFLFSKFLLFLTVFLLSSFFFESCFSFEGIFSTYQPCGSNTRIKAKIPEPTGWPYGLMLDNGCSLQSMHARYGVCIPGTVPGSLLYHTLLNIP